MDLLTPSLRESLLANGRCEGDHLPVVKFFNPVGAATWLFSELDGDGDTLFGLCDLGFGFPELGSASLSEIVSVRLPFGLSGLRRSRAALRPDHPTSRSPCPCGSGAVARAETFAAVGPQANSGE